MQNPFRSAPFYLIAVLAAGVLLAPAQQPSVQQGDFVVHGFRFRSGERLPALRLHYRTLGKPARNAHGRVTNAVLILHSTGQSGRQFLEPQFAGVLFGQGQLLDTRRYYIILPDGIGHGGSSKPRDGLRMHFPRYDYADMVAAQHLLVTEGLGINHLRLVMGGSMGCMHTWLWGESYPGFMDALMPLACLTVPIAGRNFIWRRMAVDAIRADPAWKDGGYNREPRQGLLAALDLFVIATSSALQMQIHYPTAAAANQYLRNTISARLPKLDADDLLYQLDASRDYDPSPQLGKITARVMYVNSADDFIDPPELGIAQHEIKKVKNGRFVLLPVSDQTRGHGTHTHAAAWKQYLGELLKSS
ncbi:MAG: alpha/beta fold hydrolase, partial [Terriglobia bacterium]